VNAQDLRSRLQRHYIKPGQELAGGVFLPEVQSPGSYRRCDAIYVGFYRSRGTYIDGHEIKVSRSDWLHELDQIDKAEWWFSHTHRWWLVVPDLTVAKPEELPPGWGLMVVNPRTKVRLDVVVRAELREAGIDMELLLEVVKKQDTMRSQDLKAERLERQKLIRDGIAQGVAEREERPEGDAKRTLNRLQQLTGIHLPGGDWDVTDLHGEKLEWHSMEDLAEALNAFCRMHVDALQPVKELEVRASRAKQDLRRVIEETTRLLDRLDKKEERVGA